MRGGIAPPALLSAALVVALGTAQLPLPPPWIEAVFLGCWSTLVVTAAAVHRPQLLGWRTTVALGGNAGAWAGATAAIAGTTLDVVMAAPAFALLVPAAWLVAHRRGVAVKVVSSWLIAVALLAAVLPLVPTPGYAPDHME